MAQARVSSTGAVLEAAQRVFLDKGFRAATIDDVAREAGISKPTVYQYAPSKQWLLEEIVRIMCRSMEGAQLQIHSADAPAIVRLHWLIRLNVELSVRYRHSYELTLSEQSTLAPDAREDFRRWAHETTHRFAQLLAECRGEGSFHWSGDIAVAANLIVTMLTSTYRWFHPGQGISTEILADNIAGLLSGALDECDLTNWPMPAIAMVEDDTNDQFRHSAAG